jgi:predicted outer membrane repeat protein
MTVTGCTFDSNPSDQGGGVYVQYGSVTVSNCTFTRNSASDRGGALYNAGTLTVTGCVLSSNSSYATGGALYSGNTTTVSNCTLSSNTTEGDGGAINGYLTLNNSTLSSNSAGYSGGGISGSGTWTNCTISSNSASRSGGGIYTDYTLTLTNCTVSGNSAGQNGGGLFVNSLTSATALLRNTIVAGNLGSSTVIGPDISGPLDGSSNNLVGTTDGSLSGISNASNGNLIGTPASPIDPRLGPLADNGGPTRTQAPLADSPARGAGSLTFATPTDQRGQPRVVGGEIDLGAYQVQTGVAGPVVALSEPAGRVAPPVDHVRLTFNHPMDPTSVITPQFSLSGPGGSIAVTGVTAVASTNNQQFDVAFASQTQPGDYALVVGASVRDSHGNTQGTASTRRFTILSLTGIILTVNSTADTASDSDPYLSLREAIALVNSPTLPTDLSPQIQRQMSGTLHSGGLDQIVFDPAAVTAPIVLGGTQLELSLPASTSQVVIDGGAGVTVDGNNASRILQVDANVGVTLEHLTLSQGDANDAGVASSGGAIQALAHSNVTVTDSSLVGNSAPAYGSGGAIYVQSDGSVTVSNSTLGGNSAGGGGAIGAYLASVTVTNSTLTGNSADYYGGAINGSQNSHLVVSDSNLTGNTAGIDGGAIRVYESGSAAVTNCTLTGNSAARGGAITAHIDVTVTVTNCTLSSNTAGLYDGGGICLVFSGTVTVDNSTLTDNSAAMNGGGICVEPTYAGGHSSTTVSNCTLSGNSAGVSGGGIFNGGTLTVTNSTLSANSASSGGGIDTNSSTPSSLQNTLVAGNHATAAGPDVLGTVTSTSSYNLIGDGTGLSGISNGVNHNRIGTAASPIDPLLAPLGFYGGPTQTFALLPGSPALGIGAPASAGSTDQRGLPRLAGAPSDIGAFQTQADPFLVTTLLDPGRQFGLLSLREAVNLADALPGDNTVSFSTSFDSGTVTLTQGQLELAGSSGVRTIDGGNRITIDGNHASRLFLVDATVQVVLTRLNLGNGSSDSGGAIFNSGILTLADSTLYGNAAIFGGAVCNVGTMTLYGSTLEFDFAYYQGGGLLNAGSLTAFNDTFLYDTAFHDGGAIFSATGTVTLTSLTISLNNSASGGGLAMAAGDVLLRNCIVAGNLNDTSTAASDIAGPLDASGSYNLIGTGGGGGLSDGSNHNHVGVADPGLTPPDFSSTLSPVFGFTSSSPALGAGDPTLMSDPLLRLDQHGNVRNNPPNIGAV